MSIRVMTAIWDTCLYQGGALTVLLALADWASDDGSDIYPGLDTLAAKCRMSVRGTQLCLAKLLEDAVIIKVANDRGGRSLYTEYKIDLQRVNDLQALHEEEKPDCEWCQRDLRKPKKGEERNTKRVQSVAQKGEDSDTKGEERSAHIDNHQEPSQEPSSLRESESGWETLKNEFLAWPGLPKSWNEESAAKECRALLVAGDVSIGELTACAAAHRAGLEAENAKRKKGDEYRTPHPHTWLKNRMWRCYLEEARAKPKRVAEGVAKANAIRARLGETVCAALDAAGLTGAEIETWLDGSEFEAGPPPMLILPTRFKGDFVASRYGPRLSIAFGQTVIITTKEKQAA